MILGNMVLDQIAKLRLRPIADPIGQKLANVGFTPDILTSFGLILAMLAGFLFPFRSAEPFLAGLCILGSGVTDILDGAVARATHKAAGSLNDSLADRLSDIAMYSGILYAGYQLAPVVVLLALGASLLPSYISIKGESLGVKLSSFWVGERADRVAVLAVSSVLSYVNAGVYVVLVLATLAIVQRIAYVTHALSTQEEGKITV